jgi:hypothetical protein
MVDSKEYLIIPEATLKDKEGDLEPIKVYSSRSRNSESLANSKRDEAGKAG